MPRFIRTLVPTVQSSDPIFIRYNYGIVSTLHEIDASFRLFLKFLDNLGGFVGNIEGLIYFGFVLVNLINCGKIVMNFGDRG